MTQTASDIQPALRKAMAALWWERSAVVVWPAACFPLAFVVLALLGVWQAVADPWRAMALAGCVFAALGFAGVGALGGRWPTLGDARRRVEQDSTLEHRPLQALADEPSSDDPRTLALWRTHQKRMRQTLGALRVGRPRAAYQRVDPYYVRFVMLGGVVVSAIVAGGQSPGRLGDAFGLAYLSNTPDTSQVDAWISPPDYTGKAPIFLGESTQPGAPIAAPAGSVATIRVTGGQRRPSGGVAGLDVNQALDFRRDGPDAYVATAELSNDSTIVLRRPQAREWVALVSPDTPPRVQFAGEFGESPRQELTLSYVVEDDHDGLAARLRLRRLDTFERQDIDLPAPNRALETQTARVDLIKHAWAGLEVEAEIVVADAIGQQGSTAIRTVTVPQRLFLNPLAEAIGHERVMLLREQFDYATGPDIPGAGARFVDGGPWADAGPLRLARAPAGVRRVHDALDLLQMGSRWFNEEDDKPVLLALAYVQSAIARAESMADLAGLDEVLWHAAMAAEDGDLASARRAFETARAALADALARGAPAGELEKRVQAFKQAADRYMDMLYAEAILNNNIADGQPGGPQSGPESGLSQTTDALAQMMEALEDLSATGSTEDARKLLERLGDQIANMEMQLNPYGGSGGGGSRQPPVPFENVEEQQRAQQALGDLSEMIGQQRELADDTQQQAANGGQGDTGELAQSQEELADRLGALREQLEADGEAGAAQDLAEAEQAMRQAARSLRQGDEVGAAMDQGDALGALRGAAEDFATKQLAERLGEQLGALDQMSEEEIARLAERLSEEAGDFSEIGDLNGALIPTDPFGRSQSGDTSGQQSGRIIPEKSDIQRARDILDELRRRAGETERDEDELDYIRRLLEVF